MTSQDTVVVSARRGVRIAQFGPLRISFDDRVLEPRAWTTMQSRWAHQLIDLTPAGPVLELCAGAGQIGLLAVHGTGRKLVAVDASAEACAFLRSNARAAGLAEQVEIRQSYLSQACEADEVFPVIIADPPWVPHAQIDRFPEDPVRAIDGGEDGLDIARQCLDVIAHHLHPDGAALLQIGNPAQARTLKEALPDGLVMTESRVEPRCGAVVKVVRVQSERPHPRH